MTALTAPDVCSAPVVKYSTPCLAKNAAGAVAEVVDFATDPLGYLAEQVRASVSGLVSVVLPALADYTAPDFTAAWFLRLYGFSFGLAVMLFVVLLAWELLKLARGSVAGHDFVETMLFWTPAFFLGAAFGPAIMLGLVGFFRALGDLVFAFAVRDGTDTVIAQLGESVETGDAAGIAGGALAALVVYALLFVGVIGALFIMVVQGVALYFAGALYPLGLAWVVNTHRRGLGTRLPVVIVGILAAHALLFLMLGAAFQMAGGLGTGFTDAGLQTLVNLLTAALAMVVAGLSPLLLMRFAPVMPMGSGPTSSAPLLSTPKAPASAPGDSQLGRSARSAPTVTAQARQEPEGGDGSPADSGASGRTAASRAGTVAANTGASGDADTPPAAPANPSAATPGHGQGRGSGSTAGATAAAATADGEAGQEGASGSATRARVPESAGGTGAAAAPRAAQVPAAGAGGTAGAGAAARAGQATAGAGAAASSTGVGALVGVPLVAASVAASAAKKGAQWSQEHGVDAAEAMRFGDGAEQDRS